MKKRWWNSVDWELRFGGFIPEGTSGRTLEIFYHCRYTNVIGRNQDCVISVVCTTYVFIVDFRSFFYAKLWITIPRIQFSTYFWLPEKINQIVSGHFSKKKKKKKKREKITPLVAPWGDPHFAVFRFFFDAKLWKTVHRIRFSIYFWPPEKIFSI